VGLTTSEGDPGDITKSLKRSVDNTGIRVKYERRKLRSHPLERGILRGGSRTRAAFGAPHHRDAWRKRIENEGGGSSEERRAFRAEEENAEGGAA